MKIKNLFEQGLPPKKNKLPKKQLPKKGGNQGATPKPKPDPQQTTGGTGQQTTPAPAPAPAPTPAPAPAPQPQQPTRQDPLPQPEPKRDVDFCKCWTEGNYFKKDFPTGNKNDIVDDFYIFVSQNYAETLKRVQLNVASKYCGDSNCLPHQTPTIRELAIARVAPSNLTNNENLYKVWKNSVSQSKEAEAKKTELEKPKPTIGYLNLSDASEFFTSVEDSTEYALNKGNFAKNAADLKKLYDGSKTPENRSCSDNMELYLSLFQRAVEYSFGDPKTENETGYSYRLKYWYGFLNTLFEIKRRLRLCKNMKLDSNKINRIAAIPDTSIWNLNLFKDGNSKTDLNAITIAKQNLQTETTAIRKKLIEYKQMKTLKESVRNKILLTKENKDKKVNKISENLYKIAGDFYNERYDVFFNKYVRLKESYKKSKMFLMEGASDNFQNAFVRVFKGDEEELVRTAIPWFTNKLGLEGSVKTEVEEKLKSKYSGDDIANLFEDDWSDIVVSAIINNAKSDVSEPTNAMDAVEKALMSNMRADFKEDLKNSIKNLIYPVQDSRKTEIVNLANELKNALLASKDGEESKEDTDSKVDDIFS